MSYDLIVYRTPPGRDPEAYYEEEMEAEESGFAGPPTDDPGIERCQAEIEEAIGDRVVCNRFGGHLDINFPYHYEGAEAQQIFGAIAQCLQRACTEDGLTVYDPQEGRVLSPQRDLGLMLRGNARGTGIVQDVQRIQAEQTSSPPREVDDPYNFTIEEKKPWWRFW